MAARKKVVEVEETVIIEEPIVEEVIEEVIEEVKPVIVGLKKCERLNLRKSAKADAEIIKVIENEEKIDFVEAKGDWTKVKVSGKTGYVMSQYIEIK